MFLNRGEGEGHPDFNEKKKAIEAVILVFGLQDSQNKG